VRTAATPDRIVATIRRYIGTPLRLWRNRQTR
jgi:hypothetical protein